MIGHILLFIHLLVSVALVVLIMLQQSRGADMSASFGGGSQTMFGSRGSASFLSKLTAALMGLFFLTSLGLGYVMSHTRHKQHAKLLSLNEVSTLQQHPRLLA